MKTRAVRSLFVPGHLTMAVVSDGFIRPPAGQCRACQGEAGQRTPFNATLPRLSREAVEARIFEPLCRLVRVLLG